MTHTAAELDPKTGMHPAIHARVCPTCSAARGVACHDDQLPRTHLPDETVHAARAEPGPAFPGVRSPENDAVARAQRPVDLAAAGLEALRRVACPSCTARRGEPCSDPVGKGQRRHLLPPEQVHPLRTLRAMRAQVAADAPVAVLVGCGKAKAELDPDAYVPARDLYVGDLFKKAAAYAEQLAPGRWLVLSAKHGAIAPTHKVQTYDQTIDTMLDGKDEGRRMIWASYVQTGLSVVAGLDPKKPARIVVLAGTAYINALLPYLPDAWTVEDPMRGLEIGERKAWLAAQLAAPTPAKLAKIDKLAEPCPRCGTPWGWHAGRSCPSPHSCAVSAAEDFAVTHPCPDCGAAAGERCLPDGILLCPARQALADEDRARHPRPLTEDHEAAARQLEAGTLSPAAAPTPSRSTPSNPQLSLF